MPRRTTAHMVLGLRGRMVAFFSLAAFAAALALSVVTYASTRSYLLSQRSDVAKRQAFNNAQLVRTVIDNDPNEIGNLVTNIRSERGGYAVVHLDGTDTENEFFYAQEPLRFTQSNLPEELVSQTLAGGNGRQRFSFQGDPYEAVGVAIPAVRAQYFEAFPLTDVERTLRTIQTTLLLGVALVTIGAGVLGFSTSRNVLRPLKRVANAANTIATGRLDTRLEPENDPDLNQLATSFNEMVDAVQTRIEREQRFASDVSHELRSPVTALAAAVEVLEARRMDFSDRNRQALDIVSTQVRRFDRTVLDLLELSRLDAGASESHLEYVIMPDLITRIMTRHNYADVPFLNSLPAEISSHEVLTDRRRVERVLVNLLDNARNHGNGATSVGLDSVIDLFDDLLLLSVEDAGQGIATSEQERIFERFARGTASRNSTGSGLGLAIVFEHARILGGRAWVETAMSGGARFVVSMKRTARLPDQSDES
ncbi:MAG: HAMP domain-containing sensor histidine kinase [Ilumatobacteraceae bacterium]